MPQLADFPRLQSEDDEEPCFIIVHVISTLNSAMLQLLEMFITYKDNAFKQSHAQESRLYSQEICKYFTRIY